MIMSMTTEIVKWGIFLISAEMLASVASGEAITFSYEEIFRGQSAASIRVPKRPRERFILQEVPFISQAPFGNWEDERQQHGCEEASAIMAMGWVLGKTFTSGQALEEIISISDFELKNYGEFRDTSARDTAEWILRGYYKYAKIEIKENIGLADVKRELFKGNLVIVPVNGQKLGNQFFTPPGPKEHMIVIGGYDSVTKEFIVNDPGTKHGEGLRYGSDILDGALADYKTGNGLGAAEIKKVMIVVYPLTFSIRDDIKIKRVEKD